MKKPVAPKMVAVVWEDTFTADWGWSSKDDYISHGKARFPIVTVGFLLHKDKRRVVISPSVDKNGKYSGIWSIPVATIRGIRTFKP